MEEGLGEDRTDGIQWPTGIPWGGSHRHMEIGLLEITPLLQPTTQMEARSIAHIFTEGVECPPQLGLGPDGGRDGNSASG